MKIDYSGLYDELGATGMGGWLDVLPRQVESAFANPRHGDMPQWMSVIEQLPEVGAEWIDLNAGSVSVGGACSQETQAQIMTLLRRLHPWRKGPYSIHAVEIDTEWRSDWKWMRLQDAITPLTGRQVLDVGCGNGYHCWRMKGAGAKRVVGIDPYMIYVMQYHAIRHFIGEHDVSVLPLGIEDLPQDGSLSFDTVFSMGVLYHRRSPMDHLLELRSYLSEGGELVLETLVVDGAEGNVLVPEGRYAKMRNVWFIPSCLTLEKWLLRCGFKDVRLVDVNQTSLEEQRATDWMTFESLPNFLNPDDAALTVEGYPAPKRAMFVAS